MHGSDIAHTEVAYKPLLSADESAACSRDIDIKPLPWLSSIARACAAC